MSQQQHILYNNFSSIIIFWAWSSLFGKHTPSRILMNKHNARILWAWTSFFHKHAPACFRNFDCLYKKHVIEQNTLLIYSHQEHYCCLFRKAYFCICPLNFIQTSTFVLITWTMPMCAWPDNFWKCIKNKCLRVLMLLCFCIYFRVLQNESLIQENMYYGGALLMLLLIAECNFSKNKIFFTNLLQ